MKYPVMTTLVCLCMSAAAGATVATDKCPQLTGFTSGHARVSAASIVAAGAVIALPPNNSIPASKTEYCRVQVVAKPTPDSDIRLEVWVPTGEAWNGKFEQVGNGGFAGALPYGTMAYALSLGYAVAGTDDGHQSSSMTDAQWALHHPEKITDYGWRGIHETTLASKAIVSRLTSHAPAKSYFFGCSDGGREALMMAQRYPTAFDGIIAGAPAFAMTRLLSSGALRATELGGDIAHLSPASLSLLQTRVLKDCGNGASYLQDPRSCHAAVETLACRDGATSECLTANEIETVKVMYAERQDPVSGRSLYGVQPGAEALKGSWDDWLTGGDDHTRAAGMDFTWNYLAYMVLNDPSFNLGRVSAADVARGEKQFAPIIDSDSDDLSAFKAHGGKLIQYHGWNDPAIPPGYSLEYRARLASKNGDLDNFYRLYMVPGMLHCRGGNAPTQVDWQAALESWVERGTAPGDLTASDGKGATQTLSPFRALILYCGASSPMYPKAASKTT